MRRSSTRGPRLPAVGVALAAAGSVLALASAAVAPTLAAAGDAAVVSELERVGAEPAGFRLTGRGSPSVEGVEQVAQVLRSELSTAGERTMRVDPVVLSSGAEAERRVRPVASAVALDRLELIDGTRVGGLVIPDVLADELGLSPGDPVTLGRGDQRFDIDIAGITQQIDPELAPAALVELAEAHATAGSPDARPLDLVFATPEMTLELAGALRASTEVSWHHPAPSVSTLEDAREARARMVRMAAAADDPRTTLGTAIDRAIGAGADAEVGLGLLVREADAAVAALAGPVRAVGIAGQIVALAVVAAAATFAARARTVQLRLAAVRGRSPARVGVAAAVRALPVLLIGAAGGTVAALAVVRGLGPGQRLPTQTVIAAIQAVGLALVPALAVVGTVTAVVVATAVRVGRRRRLRRLTRLPWEPIVLVLAGVAYLQLRVGGGLTTAGGTSSLHPLVLAFPVLLLAGLVGLTVRGARRVLPLLRNLGGDAPAAWFLALRRLAAGSGQGLVLAGASALALGLVVYTAALAASLSTAVEEKAIIQLGADAVAPATGLEPAATRTSEVLRTRGRLGPGNVEVDILLVDPRTIGDAAYWRPELLGGRAVEDVLAVLDQGDERLAVVGTSDLPQDLVVLDTPGFRVPIDIVHRVEALPGTAPGRPLAIASRERAAALGPAEAGAAAEVAGRWRGEVWASGDGAVDHLIDAGADPDRIRSASQASERPQLVAVTWGLAGLQSFALLATALALVGVLLFVASRQRATQISYALARRMGLGAGAHRTALGTEVIALLGIALIAAVAFGMVASASVAGSLDPVPELPPAPRLAWPLLALSGLAGALFLAGLAGAAVLQRGADRADVAEVLRGG